MITERREFKIILDECAPIGFTRLNDALLVNDDNYDRLQQAISIVNAAS